MTTLANRPNPALLVIDVQNAVVAGAHERDAFVANVSSLVEKAREYGVPVIWIQHSDEQIVRGSDSWRIVPELTPGEAEPLVEKNYRDSFEATTLETVLSELGIGRLFVAGAQTDMCVRTAGTVQTQGCGLPRRPLTRALRALVFVVAAEPPVAVLVAPERRAVEPLVHPPNRIEPAAVRRVCMVDDAVLQHERAQSGAFAHV